MRVALSGDAWFGVFTLVVLPVIAAILFQKCVDKYPPLCIERKNATSFYASHTGREYGCALSDIGTICLRTCERTKGIDPRFATEVAFSGH